MGRRRKSEFEAVLDMLFEVFKAVPAWVGPLVAVGAFAAVRFGMPLLMPVKPGEVDPHGLLRSLVPLLSWVAAGVVLVPWAAAEGSKFLGVVGGWFGRRMLERQTGLESIRELSWGEFEQLVCEAFRRRGYQAQVVGSAMGDGGVDVHLTRPGELVLVQCKQWKVENVGVKVMRELLGVVVSQGASRGILVTSGRCTPEARRFAEENSELQVIEGAELERMIREVQTSRGNAGAMTVECRPPVGTETPRCPVCGEPMVRRVAGRGPGAGGEFWGCRRYPACRGRRAG